MRTYVLTRLATLVPTLLGVTILVFLMIRLIPGTVVDQMLGADTRVTEEQRQAMRTFFGLDRPLHVQYLEWLGGLLRGDLGVSWRSGQAVTALIAERFAVTLQLALGALLISLLVGLPLGIVSAVRENTPLDHLVRVLSLFSLSIPIFWQAAMLILFFSLWLQWTPPVDYTPLTVDPVKNLQQFILPSIVLGTVVAAQLMRMTRSALLDVLRNDYVRTARAKGLGERVVVIRHALRNTLIPIVTVIGAQVGYLLGGAIVTEEVFTLPGVGRLVLNAVYQRDYPLVQGAILFIAMIFTLSNLVVDLLYGYLDPRIRYG